MADVVEVAKTGRAACRTCRQSIGKGELRFGEEAPNAFGEPGTTTRLWHHLACAAKKKPGQLRLVLASFEGDVPDRATIDALIAENEPNQKAFRFPHAERASTGRSHCGECREAIAKGELRIATERAPEPGVTPGSPRYWHVACAPGHDDPATFLAALRTNSKDLGESDFSEIATVLTPP